MHNFEIIGILGEGAYSTVYKVKRKINNHIYALKKVKMQNLTEKEKLNSLNEIRILASIKSPFIISYKEAFISEDEKSLCLIMEYADKGDLYQKILNYKKAKKMFDEIEVWKVLIQMTRGLKTLHDMKILHRDFKSANIFLFSDGAVKIGDLNVSKIIKKDLGNTQIGTPYYSSPEVWNNETYNIKSDIWSLGCITYEMLALHPPFLGDTFDDLYKKVMSGKFNKINSKYSNDMNEILKFMIKVDSKDRPTCDEILKHPIIKEKIEFFKNQISLDIDTKDDNELLKTIILPKNIIGLSGKLPKANYNKSEESQNIKNIKNNIHNTFSLPKIKSVKKEKIFEMDKIGQTHGKKTIPTNILKSFNINVVNTNSDVNNRYSVNKKENSNHKNKRIKLNNRVMEVFKLYVSPDVRKTLGSNKKKNLPSINIDQIKKLRIK